MVTTGQATEAYGSSRIDSPQVGFALSMTLLFGLLICVEILLTWKVIPLGVSLLRAMFIAMSESMHVDLKAMRSIRPSRA